MKFAFIILGKFDSTKDDKVIGNGGARIIGVASVDEACEVSKRLMLEGITCIELCGAFKEEGARRVIEATNNLVPIGFVTHLDEQASLFKKTFNE